MKLAAAVLATLLSGAAVAQGFERILLPISADLRASDGTYWAQSAYISNQSGRDLRFGVDLVYSWGYCQITCQESIRDGDMQWLAIFHRESPPWPASMIYLSPDASARVFFSSEVEASGDPAHVVAVPVVREKDFASKVEIFPFQPTSSEKRALLRVYDPDATPGGLAEITFTAFPGYVVRSTVVPLLTSGAMLGDLPEHPGYAQILVDQLTIPELRAAIPMRVTVRAVTPTRRVWAMVTVTNRDNSVQLLAPSRSGE